jgi:hypothetical protein
VVCHFSSLLSLCRLNRQSNYFLDFDRQKISMAVTVGSAVLLMGHIKNGKDYSQDGRDVNAYENIMKNHRIPPL